jgi:hypothetical protein
MNSMGNGDAKQRNEFESKISGMIQELREDPFPDAKNPHRWVKAIQSLDSREQVEFYRGLLEYPDEPILSFLEELALQDERMGMKIVEALGISSSPSSVALLQRLGGRKGSKTLQKAIRRSIFKLRSRGVHCPMVDDQPEAIYHPPRPALPEAFLSSVNVDFDRMIWLGRIRAPREFQVGVIHLNMGEGIMEFSQFVIPRRDFHEYLSTLSKEADEEPVPVESRYCHWLLWDAQEMGKQKGRRTPPAEFFSWFSSLGPPPPLQTPMIYRFISREETQSQSVPWSSAALLWEIPPFRYWVLKKEDCEKYVTLLQEAQHSRLVLTPYQKEARIADVFRQAVREIFDEERRHLLRRALEENAYVLWKQGKPQEARTCLFMTHGLEEERGFLSSHPFLEELVRRSLLIFLEEKEKERPKDVPFIQSP